MILGVHLLRRLDGAARQAPFQIRAEIEGELRLRAIAFENLSDGLNVSERGVENLGPDAAGERFGTKVGEPGVERLRRGHGHVLRARRSDHMEKQQHDAGAQPHCSHSTGIRHEHRVRSTAARYRGAPRA